MTETLERDFGPQPLEQILEEHGLTHHALVEASPTPITHKMVTRACKGRRLTRNSKTKIQVALKAATGELFKFTDLFNYR